MTEQERAETILSYDRTARQFNNSIARLSNYDRAYDSLSALLTDGTDVLDLAAGPAQIPCYLLKKHTLSVTCVDLSQGMLDVAKENLAAQKNCLSAEFHIHDITDFRAEKKYSCVLLGFGLPYLDARQAEDCIRNISHNLLNDGGLLYLSFMDGERGGFEKTSFGGDNRFYIHYHSTQRISALLSQQGFTILDKWVFNYNEPDGTISKDSVFLCRLQKK